MKRYVCSLKEPLQKNRYPVYQFELDKYGRVKTDIPRIVYCYCSTVADAIRVTYDLNKAQGSCSFASNPRIIRYNTK